MFDFPHNMITNFKVVIDVTAARILFDLCQLYQLIFVNQGTVGADSDNGLGVAGIAGGKKDADFDDSIYYYYDDYEKYLVGQRRGVSMMTNIVRDGCLNLNQNCRNSHSLYQIIKSRDLINFSFFANVLTLVSALRSDSNWRSFCCTSISVWCRQWSSHLLQQLGLHLVRRTNELHNQSHRLCGSIILHPPQFLTHCDLGNPRNRLMNMTCLWSSQRATTILTFATGRLATTRPLPL